ncbi:MAG: hypothetical protein GY784_13160, partial [Gammaproteobacteria bacterium]|nr:hypothetical protein [Gammaproteobacteria bacterium]
MHFLLFGLLGWSAATTGLRFGNQYAGLSVVAAIIFAVMDELLQSLYDTRTFSWWDLLANLSGILIFSGIAVSYYFQSRRYCRGSS